MSEYRYQYNGSNGPNQAPNNNTNNNDDLLNWGIIIAALVFTGPLGLVLLFRKLMGYSDLIGRTADGRYCYTGPFSSYVNTGHAGQQGARNTTRSAAGGKTASGEYHYSYRYAQAPGQNARTADRPGQQAKQQAQEAAQQAKQQAQAAAQQARQAAQQQAASRSRQKGSNITVNGDTVTVGGVTVTKGKKVKLPSGKGLTIAGSIVTGVFGVAFFSQLADFAGELISGYFWGYMLRDMVPMAAFLGLGLVLLFAGIGKGRKRRRFLKYLGLIGRRKSVSISTLAKATGRSYKKVCRDLQDMLDCGTLPVGYLDLSTDRLVLTPDGIADEVPQEPEEAPAPEAAVQDDDHILAEIREVNDQIADPEMSAKIDRIGEITGKILDYQRQHPGKASQLRSFLNYYLPTTLKVLRAYAQLEQQGIEGENISAAKARIEGMMDKVVEGFEKQLDKLFQNDALDITTDVAVLEKMLDKDGLSQGGLSLGG